jgi:UDP-3-O-[3-hydroxymyristoyl] glucosamine N-acyltransferase
VTVAGKTLDELAQLVGGKLAGDGRVVVCSVAAIEDAGPGAITFLANPRYHAYLSGCRASAVLVGPGVSAASAALQDSCTAFIEVADPYYAFAQVLQILSPLALYDRQISAQATVHPTATIAANVTLFPQAFVSAGARVGERSVLYPGVFLGEGAIVGADCVLHANAVVRHGCSLGNRVILHAGVVIGSDGFGYAGSGDRRIKIPQVGKVEIHDDVEIGANTTIDRATLGKTIVGRGCKIDNLVQIAHNVSIGENSVIAAQVGIAGSSKVGKDVFLAGQAGVVNHIQIGDGAMIGPQSGVAQTVPAGVMLSSGLAAAPHREWLKVMVLLPQLAKLWNLVRVLEKKVAALSARAQRE